MNLAAQHIGIVAEMVLIHTWEELLVIHEKCFCFVQAQLSWEKPKRNNRDKFELLVVYSCDALRKEKQRTCGFGRGQALPEGEFLTEGQNSRRIFATVIPQNNLITFLLQRLNDHKVDLMP